MAFFEQFETQHFNGSASSFFGKLQNKHRIARGRTVLLVLASPATRACLA
jgi:hypothetical protein